MFDSSIKRLVGDYHMVNQGFRRFVQNVFMDVDNTNTVKVMVNNKTIYSIPRDEYLALTNRMTDVIRNTTRHRYFVLYHRLVSQGINVNP